MGWSSEGSFAGYVEPGGCQAPVVEGSHEGLLVYDRSTRGIDEHGSLFHHGKFLVRQEVALP
jgi:hypothetical protein